MTPPPETDPNLRQQASRLPRSLAAFAVPNYRKYATGHIVFTTGLWMQRIAQDWLVLQLTGSVAMVGLAVALQFAPTLFLGLYGGILADRFPKRNILLITVSSAGVLALVLGILAWTGVVQTWHVMLICLLLGLVTVIDNPAAGRSA